MSDSAAPGASPAPLTRAELVFAYRAHAHSVARRAERLLGSADEAREVVQEVFMTLVERPERFAGNSSILTWLYAATTNACLKRIRDGSTRRRLLRVNGAVLERLAKPCPPDEALELRRALADLPEELQAVAVYRYLDDLSYDELADVLACSRRKVAYLLDELHRMTASVEALA